MAKNHQENANAGRTGARVISPKKDGFIMQAGILAAAGILSRVIGLLYNSPMTAIIGDEGNGYYTVAYNAYTIILLVSSYSIPSAISKVISNRLAAREYRNAHRIFKGALLYVVIVGSIASVLLFCFADKMVNLSNSVIVLRFFAPTIFLSGILGVLRGYFQAHKTMMQTSFSQILEQIINAAASIWLAYLLTGLARQDFTQKAVNGAIGGALGSGLGIAAGLLFMWCVYLLNKGLLKKRIERDKTPETLSYRAVFKMIMLVVTPFILSTCIYNLNTFLNQYIFTHVLLEVKKLDQVQVSTLNSVIGKATKISNIPIALSSAMSSALIPGIAADFSLGYAGLCREKVNKAIRTTMFVAIPAATGIGVLAKPIMLALYPQQEVLELSAYMLMLMAAGVIFYSLSTLSSAVLQGIGKVNSPVNNATAALALQTAALVAALLLTDLGIYAMAGAVVFYAFLMCILNGISVRRHLDYRQEWDKTFLRPLVVSIVMGGVTYGVYQGLFFLFRINIIALAVAVTVGMLVYLVMAVKWNVVGAKELERLPKGALLVRLLVKNGGKSTGKEAGNKGRQHHKEEPRKQESRNRQEAPRRAETGHKPEGTRKQEPQYRQDAVPRKSEPQYRQDAVPRKSEPQYRQDAVPRRSEPQYRQDAVPRRSEPQYRPESRPAPGKRNTISRDVATELTRQEALRKEEIRKEMRRMEKLEKERNHHEGYHEDDNFWLDD